MRVFQNEVALFGAQKQAAMQEAGMRVALMRGLGVDLENAVSACAERRGHLVRRLRRLLERERLRGLRRHWSYDLNRHIGLKQALNRLERTAAETGGPGRNS